MYSKLKEEPKEQSERWITYYPGENSSGDHDKLSCIVQVWRRPMSWWGCCATMVSTEMNTRTSATRCRDSECWEEKLKKGENEELSEIKLVIPLTNSLINRKIFPGFVCVNHIHVTAAWLVCTLSLIADRPGRMGSHQRRSSSRDMMDSIVTRSSSTNKWYQL